MIGPFGEAYQKRTRAGVTGDSDREECCVCGRMTHRENMVPVNHCDGGFVRERPDGEYDWSLVSFYAIGRECLKAWRKEFGANDTKSPGTMKDGKLVLGK